MTKNQHDYRQPPDAEEIERRGKVVEKILRLRARLAPQEVSTAELVERARRLEAEPHDS